MPVPATPKTEGRLLEVFSSIQGEGLLIGRRQIFLRLAECNLSCRYCDTPHVPTPTCRIEDAPGSGNFRALANPVALETLEGLLCQWLRRAPDIHHSISLTGGEPLLQKDVLREWVPSLRRILPLHLETNGTLAEALEPLLEDLEWISMDIKLQSLSGQPTPWQAHCNFLTLARRRNCQVKVVVAEETEIREVVNAARMVEEVAPEVPLVLQPVTRGQGPGIRPVRLLELQTRAALVHAPTLVIPQSHRLLDLP